MATAMGGKHIMRPLEQEHRDNTGQLQGTTAHGGGDGDGGDRGPLPRLKSHFRILSLVLDKRLCLTLPPHDRARAAHPRPGLWALGQLRALQGWAWHQLSWPPRKQMDRGSLSEGKNANVVKIREIVVASAKYYRQCGQNLSDCGSLGEV